MKGRRCIYVGCHLILPPNDLLLKCHDGDDSTQESSLSGGMIGADLRPADSALFRALPCEVCNRGIQN